MVKPTSELAAVGVIAILIAVLASFVVGRNSGINYKEMEMRKEAVKHGVAEWTHNEDGSVEFRWITEDE